MRVSVVPDTGDAGMGRRPIARVIAATVAEAGDNAARPLEASPSNSTTARKRRFKGVFVSGRGSGKGTGDRPGRQSNARVGDASRSARSRLVVMPLDSFVRDQKTGKLAIIQLPNPALWVFIAATVLRWTSYDAHDTELRWIGSGALIVWGLDELVRGRAPVRRLFGALVLGWELWQLFKG